MADITKCKGTNCPLKESCYRFLAMESLRQSYFTDVPFKDGKCEHYWKIIGNKNKIKTCIVKKRF